MILRGNVFSKTLDMDTGITIAAPNGFSTDGNYKVAYLLHGVCGNSSSWVDCSMLPAYASNGKTVFIMPDAARSFYTDMKYGFDYFTYITEELPNICKSLFNISSKREDTAIIGASMGGYGALKCALSKPLQYGICCAFSSCCLFIKEGLEDQRKNGNTPEFKAKYSERLIADFIATFGEKLEWSPKYDVLELAKGLLSAPVKPVIYTVCGTDDYFNADNNRFCCEMSKLDFDFTYEEWKGSHDFAFFNEALKKAIERFSL